ncbi:hypothetical protein SSP24_26710 [Streptomyces spinoverrucosus]|uniref:Uncharacterized protein n=1 Tax=Streptomyces spinoverrucosus TaxID=284043 RepID=A0A4Y3VJ15_9ACTN|nr:hypothetical protein SSP24_26710 [Streptomyces spinoverrucosus]GHB96586.1 hypothetical protein GCM10010397_81520 [Streptomyces spinoverrucosus]
MVQGDHQLGPVTADGGGDVAAQGDAVLDHPILVVEELHSADTDGCGTGALLLLPQRPGLGRCQCVDARFAACGEDVGDLTAVLHPGGDCGRAPEFEVVGMGHHGKGTLPVGRHRLQLRERRIGHRTCFQ